MITQHVSHLPCESARSCFSTYSKPWPWSADTTTRSRLKCPLLEFRNGSSDSVIKFQTSHPRHGRSQEHASACQRRSLRHEKETLSPPRYTKSRLPLSAMSLSPGRSSAASGPPLGSFQIFEVVRVDIAVQPDRHSALTEDARAFLPGAAAE